MTHSKAARVSKVHAALSVGVAGSLIQMPGLGLEANSESDPEQDAAQMVPRDL